MQDLIVFLSHHQSLSMAALGLVALLLVVEVTRMRKNVFNINTIKATELINRENAVIIDIRSHDSFKNGHIIDSQLIKSEDLLTNTKKIERFKKRPLIIVCDSGQMSQKTAALLLKRGYNAYALTGGIRTWLNAQLPLVKSEKLKNVNN